MVCGCPQCSGQFDPDEYEYETELDQFLSKTTVGDLFDYLTDDFCKILSKEIRTIVENNIYLKRLDESQKKSKSILKHNIHTDEFTTLDKL